MTTTLLAFDDSKNIRRVLEITFAGENYRTILANGADDAMNKLRSERPAVALLDAGLGSASGYDLCQQMKRESPGVAVIILSSKQAPYDRARGTSVGADDFIDKPFDTQQLIDKVGAAVRKALETPAAAVHTGAAPVQSNAPQAAFANRARSNTLAYGGAAADMGGAQANMGASQRAPTFTGTPPSPAQAAPTGSPGAGYASPARTSPFAQPAAATLGHSSPPTQQNFGQSATPIGGMSPTATRQAAAEPPAQTPMTAAVAPAKSAGGAAAAVSTATDGQFAEKLARLGLTRDQIQGVLALSREVVEQVVWEVVPVLAETLIKEEIRRLTTG